MFSSLPFVISLLSASVVAQSSSTVVCIAGQCLQGLTNVTIGATISAPGAPTSIHLLPGQYTSSTNPQLLHNLLTAPSASLTSSPGFESSSSSISLPLNLALAPGLAIYSDIRFSGQAAFSQLPSSSIANSSVPLAAKSFAISTNVWASIRSSSEERIVFWDTVPDVTQLPADALGSLALLDLQSSACSPPCAGTGVCSASGTCACPSGFTGSACESCAPGFFGPTLTPPRRAIASMVSVAPTDSVHAMTVGRTQTTELRVLSVQLASSSQALATVKSAKQAALNVPTVQVLQGGTCISANCNGSSSVIPGLGICLSELVAVPQPSGTSTPAPLPSITGLTNPTVIENETRRPLEWWQILLMALGCAFIFVLVLMLWRRHARKQRAKRTAMFAQSKNLDDRNSWKWRLVRFGERLFGHRPSRRVVPESEDIKLLKLRQAEEARRDHDLEKLIDSYGDPTTGGPSGGSSSDPHASSGRRRSHLAANSLYSEATGIPRRSPDVRQPVKDYRASARMSTSTYSSYMYRSNGPRVEKDSDIPPVPTEAQVYATAMKPVLASSPPATQGSYWIQPVATGSSNNPFRK
ncbi:hypothetical protein CCMSSC00406_0008364 [Pleurotus cornucopiae]|uniref:Uncharacterized protein n=1 Tax=Pleurotus cornucopiae TaxID=5321 RepID=A0ACB7J6X7_PLECO|nr:hypothetical protein CCMSSC00406_0008364 [Pleurotus cornucopiae]